jgi:hypothetical protein
MQSYDYFKKENGKYILIEPKIKYLIGSIFCFAFGLYVALVYLLDDRYGSSLSDWVMPIVIGAVSCGFSYMFFDSFRTKTVFDPSARTVMVIKSSYSSDSACQRRSDCPPGQSFAGFFLP